MPTWDKILKETDQFTASAIYDKYVRQFSEITGNTVICYLSAFSIFRPYNVPSPLHSIVDQDIQGFMTCSNNVDKKTLDLVIHTPGGDYEATKRIISYLLKTYEKIRVFVPHLAMSGGTLMACAADEIYMGHYSSLGPTDPQVLVKGNYLPVGAVISEFKRAFKEVEKNPQRALLWNERLKQVPLGRIDALKTMKKNSNEFLANLLKMRNCHGKSREEIDGMVKVLNSHKRHSSHGKGISLDHAQEIGLNVKNLSEKKNKELEEGVLSLYHAATVLFHLTSTQKIISNNFGRKFVQQFGKPNE